MMEMYNPEPDRCKAFWTALQDVWLKLYGSTFPTAAAINVCIHAILALLNVLTYLLFTDLKWIVATEALDWNLKNTGECIELFNCDVKAYRIFK